MAVLVTGGAGYIGSHTVCELLDTGKEVVTFDSLETGHQDAVLGGKFYQGDIRNKEDLMKVFSENDISGVIHFAAYSLVGESMKAPFKYYHNNVHGTSVLLQAMVEAGVKNIIFSSSAATYGEPENIPIKETDKTEPTNCYGQTKLAMEGMLKWFDEAHDVKYTALRYFNAAGAHENLKLGERHNPETHLIPIILQVANGQREKICIFGEDYDTPDGTCIRDYIHVTDLADAHIKALERLEAGGDSTVYNLGNGNGFSVKEVIEMTEKVVGKPITKTIEARRAGDPAILVASNEKATRELDLNPRYADLETIIGTAWKYVSQ